MYKQVKAMDESSLEKQFHKCKYLSKRPPSASGSYNRETDE